MRIGIDVDEVVASLHVPWIQYLNRKYRLDLSYFWTWDMQTELQLSDEEFYEFLQPGIYLDGTVKVLPGVHDAVESLRGLGGVSWVSQCGVDNSHAEAKHQWLKRHDLLRDEDGWYPIPVGERKWERVKYLDLMIDDSVTNCRGFLSQDVEAVLISRPHNINEEWEGVRAMDLLALARLLRLR